jgi:ribosomal protein S12 methylthiotransferase accessory factor
MLASYRGLQKTAIHPNECMLFSEAQYDSGSQSQSFNAIPRPLDVDARIEWTPVWSLTERCHKYLPTSYCYYGYPIPAAASYCWADSNGAAAGNTIEEAVLQGLLELVERDCVALWWYNRVQRPQVDLKSFGIPYIQQLEKHYLNLGRSIWVLDISSDLNIPSFAAISRRTNDPKEEIGLGFGSHLDPRIGVVRALTELNQFLAEADFYNRQRIGHSPDELDEADRLFRRWFEAATLENQPYLAANESADLATCESYPATWRDDIRENILFIQNNLSRRGMEVLVLDQTRPDVGLAVAKVFVPGLRHFWARFAPGRLYDVPVEIGWLNRPLSEHELNPIHMFL